ncbi:MAG: peptide ABC transporter substrate-binding protein [Spirochaetaceae bacterium]
MRSTRVVFIALFSIVVAGVAAQTDRRSDLPDVPRSATFRVAVEDSDFEMNPMYAFVATEAQIFTGLFEGLVGYNPLTLEPVPGVARRWDVLDDGTLYRFHIRSDARYENGDPVLAEHFRETWIALLSLGDEAAYGSLFDDIVGARDFRRGRIENADAVGVTAVDDRTLEIRLRRRTPHFTELLAHHSFSPLHPDVLALRDFTDVDRHIGNGPFRLVSYDEAGVVMDRNEEYWASDSVTMDRIVYDRIADARSATDLFFDREVDWNTGLIAFDGDFDSTDLVVNPLFATTFYFIRAEQPPWSDDRVRRAMALALPWDTIRSPEVYFTPTTRLVPEIPGYPEPEMIGEQNREEALRLLAEAGFPNGEGLPDPLIRIPGGDSARVAGIMRDSWDDAFGVDTQIETVAYPDYFSRASEPEVTVGLLSWIGDITDPVTFLKLWVSESTLNEAGFISEEYDALIEGASGMEGAARFSRMSDAESLLLSTGTILPVSHSSAFNLINLDMYEGWFPNPLDIHPVRYIRRTGDEPAPGVVNARQIMSPEAPGYPE